MKNVLRMGCELNGGRIRKSAVLLRKKKKVSE